MWQQVARSNVQQISYIPVGISLRTFFLLLVRAEDSILHSMKSEVNFWRRLFSSFLHSATPRFNVTVLESLQL